MSRKPAIIELAGGKSRRQRIWEAIRLQSGVTYGTFTADGLSRASKVEIEPVRDYLKGLAAGGWISVVNGIPGRGVKKVYRLERDNGVEAPRVRPDGSEVTQGRGTEALWAAMTTLDSFTHAFLAELANVKVNTAKAYCLVLAKAGYLDILEPGKGTGAGGIQAVYTVKAIHRSKPRAPMITRLKSVYDPNTHQVVWAEGADDAADAIEAGEVLA